MVSDNGKNKLSDVLEGLSIAVSKLSNVDIEGELTGTLSKEDRAEVEKFKNTSEVIKEAQAKAAEFNAGKWNI